MEKIDIKNDLKKKEIKELFKKLNKEYINCFEQLKINRNNKKYSNEINFLLDKIDIDNFDYLINMPCCECL